MTLIQISRLYYFDFFSKTNHQMIIYLTANVNRQTADKLLFSYAIITGENV